jgi:hypothetical protein
MEDDLLGIESIFERGDHLLDEFFGEIRDIIELRGVEIVILSLDHLEDFLVSVPIKRRYSA